MYRIDKNECIECGFCERICPKGAIRIRDDFAYEIGKECISCGLCAKNCPVNAIEKVAE